MNHFNVAESALPAYSHAFGHYVSGDIADIRLRLPSSPKVLVLLLFERCSGTPSSRPPHTMLRQTYRRSGMRSRCCHCPEPPVGLGGSGTRVCSHGLIRYRRGVRA
jgi:hypothetical protein